MLSTQVESLFIQEYNVIKDVEHRVILKTSSPILILYRKESRYTHGFDNWASLRVYYNGKIATEIRSQGHNHQIYMSGSI